MPHNGVVVVHVGAGYHSASNVPQYRQACATALKIATEMLRVGADAALVACEAVRALEAAACTNAGRGSNLALNGRVECDAGIMVDGGDGARFAAVGAVPDQPHPVRVAHRMLQLQRRGLSLDRQPPVLLVGEQANTWARQHGLGDDVSRVSDDSLITPAMLERYCRAKRRLEQAESQLSQSPPPPPAKCAKFAASRQFSQSSSSVCAGDNGDCSAAAGRDSDSTLSSFDDEASVHYQREEQGESDYAEQREVEEGQDRLDTVGAVVIDCSGAIAAAASSGGILLKHPGRVGQAAVYGCGCWADAAATTGGVGVGSCTSGCGELLIMTCLARRVAAEVSRCQHAVQGAQTALKRGFLGSQYIGGETQRLAGAVVLRHDRHLQAVDVVWAHCSASFVVGYHTAAAAAADQPPQTLCSRLPDEGQPGVTVLSQGITVRLTPCDEHSTDPPPSPVASTCPPTGGGGDTRLCYTAPSVSPTPTTP